MTLPDTERLLAADDDDTFVPERERALFELLYATGLRVSEAAGLDCEDVDLSERLARVTGKGSRERIVPFGEAAADALRAYLPSRAALRHGARRKETGSSEPLFVNARGGRLTPRSMARLLKRRLRAAGPAGGNLAARPAAHVRDAPAAGRRRPARDPGAARPRVALDDAEVHAPRRGAPARGVPECASEGLTKMSDFGMRISDLGTP